MSISRRTLLFVETLLSVETFSNYCLFPSQRNCIKKPLEDVTSGRVLKYSEVEFYDFVSDV